MKTLVILHDPPYGSERSYNGLRLARALSKAKSEVSLFLLADAVVCAKLGQKVPQGFYNIELMVKSVLRTGEVLACGTCLDARGLADEDLIQGVQRSSMEALAQQTLQADKVLVF